MVDNEIIFDDLQKQKAFEKIDEGSNFTIITGEAGTGKSFFIEKLVSHYGKSKNIYKVAPTGRSAVNIGGATIHKMFSLPIGMLNPEDAYMNAENKISVSQKFRINKNLSLYRNSDIWIIDEFSMVRADTLDAINVILQVANESNLPFGGKQVIICGDRKQLQPIISNSEKEVFERNYRLKGIRGSKVWGSLSPHLFVFKNKYRQKERRLINFLNSIRSGVLTEEDISFCNEMYSKQEAKNSIKLSAKKDKVKQINDEMLERLDAEQVEFLGEAKNFKESDMISPKELILKEGCRIMLLKNINGRINGDTGFYKGFVEDEEEKKVFIKVQFDDQVEDDEITLIEKAKWEVFKYKSVPKTLRISQLLAQKSYCDDVEAKRIDEEVNQIKSNPREKVSVKEVDGWYKQFPITLGYAFTIHKSQGMSIENLCLDFEGVWYSQAKELIYVACSRAINIEGLKFSSKFPIDYYNLK